ncbi:MAG: tRNA lysidine(34) synthetase TilS [Bacteroidales bacterium]|nr:tRNA lysidine(34) synthetase TilS [Bacteroidales bacterium]
MLLSRFVEQCEQLFGSDARLLLAVSGGRDSMALEHLCKRAGFNYAIAHCNFHLRGADSERDERFVRQLATQHRREIFVAQFDTSSYAAEHGLSIEEAAREQRYAFFEHVRSEQGFDYIVVAHHRDDTIETFFINLLRGTGISGLRGMRALNGFVARPLLAFGRAEIDAYIGEHNIEYVEDVTNAELVYRRNEIRHRLLPLLREMSPSFDSTMQRTMNYLADAEQVYMDRVGDLRAAMIKSDAAESYSIAIDDVRSLKPQCTLLYELLKPFGFNVAQVEDILCALDAPSGRRFLTEQYVLVKDRERLLIVSRKGDGVTDVVPQIETDRMPVPADISLLRSMTTATTAFFDADKVALPIRLRHWQEGDRFCPFGMRGSQLVSDYFSDHKLSLVEKREQWLLVDADERVLWIVGRRTDRRASVTTETEQMLRVTIC